MLNGSALNSLQLNSQEASGGSGTTYAEYVVDGVLAAAGESNVLAAGNSVTDTVNSVDVAALAEALGVAVSEIMQVGEQVHVARGTLVSDSVGVVSAQASVLAGVSDAVAALSIGSTGIFKYDELLAQVVSISEAVLPKLQIDEEDGVTASAALSSALRAVSSVVQAALFEAAGAPVSLIDSAEAVQVLDYVVARLTAALTAQEAVQAADDVSVLAFVVVDAGEGVAAGGEAVGTAAVVESISEGVSAAVAIRLGDEVYEAWLVNTETSGASRYDNFPFNSMAAHRGRYYGAAEDGIYLLEGGDDAGIPINASVKTGLRHFGSQQAKRMGDVFLGVTTAGDLVLKVQADENGVRTETWYSVQARGDAANHRVKLGQGAKSPYWSFELVNVDGADFQLDNLQLHPLILTRKV